MTLPLTVLPDLPVLSETVSLTGEDTVPWLPDGATSRRRERLTLSGVFRHTVSTPWVVTATGADGPVGFITPSVTLVSSSPPLVSFVLAKTSGALVTIARTGRAALHLLAHDQRDLAERLAKDDQDRFATEDSWRYDDHGLPLLQGSAARLLTRLVELVDAGDGFVAVARAEHGTAVDQPPLVRYDDRYATFPTGIWR